MSELVKRQHFVPRTYLKHFGHTRGGKTYIYTCPKEGMPNKIRETNVEDTAVKKHLYTLPGNTIAQKMAIEKFYSRELEAHYDSIYKILTDPRRIKLSPTERELIVSTVVTMFYRTTWWLSTHQNNFNNMLHSVYRLCEREKKDYFNFNGTKISIVGKTPDQLTREYTKEHQPTMMLNSLEIAIKLISLRMKKDVIVIHRLTNEKAEFITSDNPVTAQNLSGNTIPFDDRNILRLPLDAKHMLSLTPLTGMEELNTVNRHRLDKINERFNKEQLEMSERFVFGSQTGLKLFLEQK